MRSAALGVVAGWVVVRLLGAGRRFPWRVVDLSAPAASGAPTRRRVRGRAVGPRGLRRPGRWTGRAAPGPVDRESLRPGGAGRGPKALARAIDADLPRTVDLLFVAVTAGHSLHTAVAAVGRLGTGPVARGLGAAVDRFERGARLLDGIEAMPEELGDAVRPLVTTLVVSSASGAPLAPALQRLADAERRRGRRRAETRVRRLPVLLLGPLVALVLPAFVLLTIVPVVITTARAGLEPALGLLGPSIPTIPWSPT